MRRLKITAPRMAVAVMIAGLSAAPVVHAEPGGCIKYGAAGALGGHLMHHGVLGATGGCAAGMITRHEYREKLRQKAALYDKEHPADPNQSWWQRHHNTMNYEQKATLWDKEHPEGAPDAAPPSTPPASPGG